MRFISFLVAIFLTLPVSGFAQLFEDFEEGSKTAYAPGVVDFSTGPWLLDDALIGSAAGDRFHGTRSVRIRDGFLEMQFDYPDGAGTLSFWGANSGFSGDTVGAVQIYYSSNGGENWQPAADQIQLTEENELHYYELELNIEGPVRFRFEKSLGNRINIDDIRIEPYVELFDQPTLSAKKGRESIHTTDIIEFDPVNAGEESTIKIRITNHGIPNLEITSVELENGQNFSVVSQPPSLLASRESFDLTIQFTSDIGGTFEDTLTILTNDPDQPEFKLHLRVLSVDEHEIISIQDARMVPFETRVTISGRITVANEFDGPAFLQDESAGMAVFYEPFHQNVQHGDSVIVTGPVTEFNPFGGTPGTFLRQIAATDQDDDISFEIIDAESVYPEAEIITISEMNDGDYESRLVSIEGVTFQADGVFQGNQNYGIADRTASGELRIDNSVNELIGAEIPAEPVEVTGVVDRFNGTYQLKPRDNGDLQVEPYEIAGEDVPKNHTFDVVTWNIEWFGAEDNGPDDLNLQMNNVIKVIETINADLYALQEIANTTKFFELTKNLPDYRGFLSSYPQRQQTAYLFKSAVIDSISSGQLLENQNRYDWASGRFPLFFEFDATIRDQTRRITSYNIHAKAFDDQESYNRRKNAAISLKEYFDEQKRDENIIFLGDFNDQLNFSTYNEEESPYHVFLDDERYFAVTKPLEDRGFASFLVGQFRSMIDHIIIKNDLIDYHIDGAQRVENPHYIASYVSTTTDHAPVWTRFNFSNGDAISDEEIPETFVVKPNYPNPFNSTTTLRFSLPEPAEVSLSVHDILGQTVAILADNESFSAGSHQIIFDASGLSSGMYLYQIELDSGHSKTKKMMFVK